MLDAGRTAIHGDTAGQLGGAHCNISVTFTPLAKGLHVADIQLQLTGSVDPTPLVMTGTGVLP